MELADELKANPPRAHAGPEIRRASAARTAASSSGTRRDWRQLSPAATTGSQRRVAAVDPRDSNVCRRPVLSPFQDDRRRRHLNITKKASLTTRHLAIDKRRTPAVIILLQRIYETRTRALLRKVTASRRSPAHARHLQLRASNAIWRHTEGLALANAARLRSRRTAELRDQAIAVHPKNPRPFTRTKTTA